LAKYSEEQMVFLSPPEVPADNHAERQIRFAVVIHKNLSLRVFVVNGMWQVTSGS